MAWRKSPASLIEQFDRILPADERIERRKMFGYPCAFVNGNMFTGLHQEDLILRLSEADRGRAQTELGAGPFEPMKGRRMREYVAVPETLLSDENALGEWMARSLAYAGSLPPKTKQPRKSRAKKSRAAGRAT